MIGLLTHVTSVYWSMLNTCSGSATSHTAVKNCLHTATVKHRLHTRHTQSSMDYMRVTRSQALTTHVHHTQSSTDYTRITHCQARTTHARHTQSSTDYTRASHTVKHRLHTSHTPSSTAYTYVTWLVHSQASITNTSRSIWTDGRTDGHSLLYW